MFGWLKIKSSLTPEQVRWLDERFEWLRNEFGERRLGGPVITPTAEFFPDLYRGTHDDAEKMFDRVCDLMGVERSRVKLKLFRDSKADIVHSSYSGAPRGHAAGVYDEHEEAIDIWLETTRLDEPDRARTHPRGPQLRARSDRLRRRSASRPGYLSARGRPLATAARTVREAHRS